MTTMTSSASAPAPTSSAAPTSPPLSTAALGLLTSAHRDLAEASIASRAADRYAAAHRGALHTAAAVLAVRARPVASTTRSRRSSPRSAWDLLARVAPEFAEWALLFAAGAGKRAAAEAGLRHAVSEREADDLVREVEGFLRLVETGFGLSTQAALPLRS